MRRKHQCQGHLGRAVCRQTPNNENDGSHAHHPRFDSIFRMIYTSDPVVSSVLHTSLPIQRRSFKVSTKGRRLVRTKQQHRNALCRFEAGLIRQDFGLYQSHNGQSFATQFRKLIVRNESSQCGRWSLSDVQQHQLFLLGGFFRAYATFEQPIQKHRTTGSCFVFFGSRCGQTIQKCGTQTVEYASVSTLLAVTGHARRSRQHEFGR